jgi:rhodanese-related sulfurtransferase
MTSARPHVAALLLLIAALALVAGCGSDSDDAEPSAAAEPFQVIDVDTLATQRDELQDLQILDVRTPEEVAEGTIPGALNIPHDEVEAGSTEGLDLDRPIAAICRSGNRATTAGEALVAAGATDVRVVRPGGVGTWQDAGYPIVVP